MRRIAKAMIGPVAAILLLVGSCGGCVKGSYRNVEHVKAHADARWAELGYEVIAYEGCQADLLHGGEVWHALRRADSPGAVYSGWLGKWGDEIHVYGPWVISGDWHEMREREP